MSKPSKTEPSEVGSRYSLTIERHATKPLWRLRERALEKSGTPTDVATEWRAFPEFSPDLLLAQGRLKRFVFPNMPRHLPAITRRG